MNANDTLLDGKVVILSVDSAGRALTIEFPTIQDAFGNPQTITFAYGIEVDSVLAIAHGLGL